MLKTGKIILIACLAFVPASVSAQGSEFFEAFSGEWIVFDPKFSTDGAICVIELEVSGQSGSGQIDAETKLNANSKNCSSPIDNVVAWGIEENQLALFSDNGQTIARLGGNQSRITGDLQNSSDSIVLDRSNGGSFQGQFSKALKRHGCIYLGYSSDCASADQLLPPQFDAEGRDTAPVTVLVELNVREQPRRDATVLGRLPAQSCLSLNYCSTTGDGVWCRASFGETVGWISKSALRQGEWPVTTYVNGCEEES